MLEFYKFLCETYNNNEYISTSSGIRLIEESLVPLEEYSLNITSWDTLWTYYEQNGLWLPFTLYNTKKGRKLSFFSPYIKVFDKNTWDIKEWKQPELDIEIKYKIKKIKRSLDEIYQWNDAEKAHRYLKEHNLL